MNNFFFFLLLVQFSCLRHIGGTYVITLSLGSRNEWHCHKQPANAPQSMLLLLSLLLSLAL
jgi:hypothetical protein